MFCVQYIQKDKVRLCYANRRRSSTWNPFTDEEFSEAEDKEFMLCKDLPEAKEVYRKLVKLNSTDDPYNDFDLDWIRIGEMNKWNKFATVSNVVEFREFK